MRDILRRCVFSPYRKGMGPKFYLTMWATGRYDNRGQEYVGYSLTRQFMSGDKRLMVPLFTGEDYSPSPMHAIDSDASVAGLMCFLTTQPDDIESPTNAQLGFWDKHAETLSYEVSNRFGEV